MGPSNHSSDTPGPGHACLGGRSTPSALPWYFLVEVWQKAKAQEMSCGVWGLLGLAGWGIANIHV